MIHFSQLEKITGGTILQIAKDDLINSLCIDSRKATTSAGTLFFAIKGERHDGHQYIGALYEYGVRQFVVEQSVLNLKSLPDANLIQVQSCVAALQQLAGFHRRQFAIPVVGITGSNGKTIIKEWLYQMLSKDRVIVKNPGSYNSQIGVPLSVWQIQSYHSLGIFEAGISKPGEMAKLKEIMRPTIGIFTNIGSAHNEGFQNQAQKISEKLKLFEDTEILIYCRDHESIHTNIAKTGIHTLSWGSSTLASVQTSFHGSLCTLQYKNQLHTLNLPFLDSASRENCLHCITAMLHMGYGMMEIQNRVNGLRAIPMRMELKESINQCQLIDDSYNNDLGGLEIALQFLTNQHQKKNKRLILSDILESGLEDEELAGRVASLVNQNLVQNFVGIGPVLNRFKHFFAPTSAFFPTTEDFLNKFDLNQLQQEIILVKGARVYGFERIIRRLQRKVHGTVMEIDLGALVHNLNFFKSKASPTTKVMVMVKAFAYGSGSTEIANILQYHKADYLGVAYADEGIELRMNNIALPIMVMNPSHESFDAILNYNLEPEIYSLPILRSWINFLAGRSCRIHIKLDTGMHRLGFDAEDIQEVINLLSANTNIGVASIFSHLAGADDSRHDSFSKKQLRIFMQEADEISYGLGYKPLYHILNSSGILRLPEMQLDMVRLGIGLYGVDPTGDGLGPLRPVATLKTLISQIKRIKRGETIGYGRKGLAEQDSRIAVIAIGYADGYSRAFSDGVGEVL
ncbi:MAG: bifunctional UDP-N-acetylmuramoyl-tripeptide:D-alanyl-D-alanine ligase/alanine racemase, partial [Cyclobacteriaceae bacterium]|nr:bifunctional UDP-N-acetylmuramoyl-tripeptide:D-alanyl-D-alanine ligase/alanine racemase [Cyclobacteriaceae bacterium]